MRLWQIVVMVGLGVLFGTLEPGKLTYAADHATLYVFLPPLLFEAAWNLNYRAILRQWTAIAALAGPGVVITALVVAGSLSIVRVPLGPALLAGAILSATDPIAVVAVFRRLRVPKTLATIVECESLFNDAVAVVLYRAVLAALALGSLSIGQAGGIALVAVLGAAGGVALGASLAFVLARVLRHANAAPLQIAGTIACAYGAYFAADALHLSGIFATIASGIALRYFERRWITLTIDRDVLRFWDVLAVIANALVFFLVGAALQIGVVVREPAFIIACLVAIAASRWIVAVLLVPARYPEGWLGVIRIAGMRGALSLALALALPESMPYRQAIVDATFAVALATLVASALATERVVKRVTP